MLTLVFVKMAFLLRWTFVLFGAWHILMALALGWNLPVGLLAAMWYRRVVLCRRTVLRASLRLMSALLLVTCSRDDIRLMLAILLAMARLIRTCGPTLTNMHCLLALSRNLIALVPMQLTRWVKVMVLVYTWLCRVVLRPGVGVSLIIPRRCCRME